MINILELDGHLFAQDISTQGNDTISIRANKNTYPSTDPIFSNCKALLEHAPDTPSGFYTIDPDGFGGQPEFKTYCEMEQHGGGWTLMGIRYVLGLDYSDKTNLSGYFNETYNIFDFSQNHHLTDAQWVDFKYNSREMLLIMPQTGTFAIADIDRLKAANCLPLQDTLGINHNKTGEHRFRLFWNENSGCSGSGTDYSMLNYSNIYNMSSSIYKETNVGSYATSKTTHIFVR
ncbi:fibrinogen-like YCDxxxxGGGW domain-containing protein [Pseudoalteromonas piscicida]